jgi:Ethanolamine utilization protein EutJ (predicted chaperonin)
MKASIEIVQAEPIPANVSERAVDLAAHTAQLAAEQEVVKAARATVRAVLEADPDYKDAKKRKKELKKRIAPEVEEITALETAAKEKQGSTDAWKCMQGAVARSGKIRKAITRKLADSGQMMLPYYVEER